jgi:membrane protein
MKVLRATWDHFGAIRGGTLAAAISYRALFALAPLLVVAVAVAGGIFGEDAANGELAIQLERALGPEIAAAVQELVISAGDSQSAGWIGVLVFIWAGSGLFVEFQGALRVIYDIAPERMQGFWSAVRRRLVTVAAVVASAFMLAITVAGATAAAWLRVEWAERGLGWLVSAAVLIGGLALAFRYLTIERPPWRFVGLGALATAMAALVAGWGVGLFIARGGGGGASGVAGSLVAVLLTVYVLAIVVLFGASLARTAAAAAQPKLSRL